MPVNAMENVECDQRCGGEGERRVCVPTGTPVPAEEGVLVVFALSVSVSRACGQSVATTKGRVCKRTTPRREGQALERINSNLSYIL